MGIGKGRGQNRALEAAEAAVSSPLLEASIEGAHGVLLTIAGGSDLGLHEVNAAAAIIADAADPDANIIFGTVIDDSLGDEVKVTVIAAGFAEVRSGKTLPPSSVEGQRSAARRGSNGAGGLHALSDDPRVVDRGAQDDLDIPEFLKR